MQPRKSLTFVVTFAVAVAVVAPSAFVQLNKEHFDASCRHATTSADRQAFTSPGHVGTGAAKAIDWTTSTVASAIAAGLLLGLVTAPGPVNAYARDDVDSQYLTKRLNGLMSEASDAKKKAEELGQLAEQKGKALELYKKLDAEREAELTKLQLNIKKNEETRKYVLADLAKRIGAGDSSPELAQAKQSFEDFYASQLEKQRQMNVKFAKERKTREAVIKDIQKTKASAKEAAEEAMQEQRRVQDMLDELTDRSPLPED
eukprot:TRINITY_DN8876_c0_g1_i1.p1 TRINITY_DN8876_c0_g1~~TRINITY_DN8876_c0_g1_i1.p1  ORF type:complete len:259 (-),score=84.94 TRINITY_DN8876_c0_g1_i1:127-903(-)